MGIKDDPLYILCTFCKNEEETSIRLLWECNITNEFENHFIMAAKSQLQRIHAYIDLVEKLFLFGLET